MAAKLYPPVLKGRRGCLYGPAKLGRYGEGRYGLDAAAAAAAAIAAGLGNKGLPFPSNDLERAAAAIYPPKEAKGPPMVGGIEPPPKGTEVLPNAG